MTLRTCALLAALGTLAASQPASASVLGRPAGVQPAQVRDHDDNWRGDNGDRSRDNDWRHDTDRNRDGDHDGDRDRDRDRDRFNQGGHWYGSDRDAYYGGRHDNGRHRGWYNGRHNPHRYAYRGWNDYYYCPPPPPPHRNHTHVFLGIRF